MHHVGKVRYLLTHFFFPSIEASSHSDSVSRDWLASVFCDFTACHSLCLDFGMPLLLLTPAVQNLRADSELTHSQGSDAEMLIPGDLPTFGQDLLDALLWCSRKVEVADGGLWF